MMNDIIPFLKQKWLETNKAKLIESTIAGFLFMILVLGWLHLVFMPIDDYLKIHTFKNTDHIVMYSMLGFIISSFLAGLYLLRFVEYYVVKLSLNITKLINGDAKQ